MGLGTPLCRCPGRPMLRNLRLGLVRVFRAFRAFRGFRVFRVFSVLRVFRVFSFRMGEAYEVFRTYGFGSSPQGCAGFRV